MSQDVMKILYFDVVHFGMKNEMCRTEILWNVTKFRENVMKYHKMLWICYIVVHFGEKWNVWNRNVMKCNEISWKYQKISQIYYFQTRSLCFAQILILHNDSHYLNFRPPNQPTQPQTPLKEAQPNPEPIPAPVKPSFAYRRIPQKMWHIFVTTIIRTSYFFNISYNYIKNSLCRCSCYCCCGSRFGQKFK